MDDGTDPANIATDDMEVESGEVSEAQTQAAMGPRQLQLQRKDEMSLSGPLCTN